MKFVCNNCGFSAEVPDRRSNCPMCASSNVTVSAHTENPVAQEKIAENKPEDDVHTPQTVEAESATKIKQEKNSGSPRKEKITLSDDFFDSKAEKEEQEIASILKELDPEAGEVKTLPDMTRWIKTGGIAGAVLIILAVVVYFLVSGGGSDNSAATAENNAEAEDSEPVEPEKEVAAEQVEPAEQKLPEESPVVAKEEPEAKEQPVEKVEDQKVEPVKKEEAAVQKVEEPKKQEPVKPKPEPKKQEPAKQAVKKTAEPVKKAAVKQTAPKTGGADAFNNFVQAGHKALSEKRYTDALHEYKNASRINPGNGPIYKFLGIAYAYLQNQEQACVNYRKYIQLSPNAPDKEQVEAFIKACP